MAYPPQHDPLLQQRTDDEHLRTLAIFHYILGGLAALGSTAFLLYALLGVALVASPPHGSNPVGASSPEISDSPALVGGMFIAFGIGAALFGWIIGGLTAYVGKCLVDKRKATLITVVSVINCLNVPFGLALGVFTLIVLNRPSVRARFDDNAGWLEANRVTGQAMRLSDMER